MIINSFIGSNSNIQNIDLSTPEIFLEKIEGETIELSFSYSNLNLLSGYSVLYLNGNVIDSQEISNSTTTIIDITEFLTSTGFYTFKLIVIDEEESIDSLDFKILYNYQNASNFSFLYESSNNTYILVAYTGQSSIVNIPPVFNGQEGVLPVAKIANGVFFDNDVLTSVEIPSSVVSIGATAFFSCTNLSEVKVYSQIPPVLEANNVFDPYDELSLLKIYVPSDSVDQYKAAENWSEYSNDILALP